MELCGQYNCLGLFVPTMRGDGCLRSRSRVALVLLRPRRVGELPPGPASEEDVHRHLLETGTHCSAILYHLCLRPVRTSNKASSEFLKIGRTLHLQEQGNVCLSGCNENATQCLLHVSLMGVLIGLDFPSKKGWSLLTQWVFLNLGHSLVS